MLLKVARLLLCGVLGGAVVAAAALPVAIVAGGSARAGGDTWESLPTDLATPRPAQISYVYANDGRTLITAFYDENRQDVPLDQVAPVLRQAVVAAEDTRFYEHHGVDIRGVARAFVSNSRGGAQQGASTLTMQYVRNVLKNDPGLTPQQHLDALADTPVRKVREMRYAQAIEKKLGKNEILQRYLNIAYFGAGAYGIAAAAQTYFGKSPAALTLPEAALLAGLLQSPDADNPISGDRTAALERRAYTLDAMARTRAITAPEAAAAAAADLRLAEQRPPNDCTSVAPEHNDWGFFCDYFRQWWNGRPEFGATPAERDELLRTGGFRIVTALDPGVQAAALAQSLGVYGYGNARSLPIAVVAPGSGRVQALAVNRHYSLEPGRDNTVNQLVAGGAGVAGYQAGSTFKMFTMLAALDAGMPLSTRFKAPSRLASIWPASGPGTCGGRWCPGNDNPSWMDGDRTMWNAFGRSVNTYFVWLEQQVGARRVVEMAQRLGITFRGAADAAMAGRADQWGSFTLGVASTTPLDLANAYAAVAAGGVYCEPLPALSITDPDGRRLDAGDPRCRQVVDPDVAAAATDAARCPVGRASAAGRCDGGTAENVSAILAGRPVAGKTGSSENNATETFAGFTPQVAAAGIAVNTDSPNDRVGAGISGAVNSAVAQTMAAALRGQPVLAFPPPSRRIAT
ncbi:transglycosylase domain-containing protein [Dactylosporangium matsuzakiense]|uniref:Penicillin-binding protein n=1 Tax=Dactylosporangium matsuzakiense TaxID=53360 RepID=A0A9W6NNF9_9ACTN|nr:transglycosylase domain-containing protein [Dactylosporangium matsuzakiense]UWZ42963.1 transglycosylase domain-containing protein [Dactylosporangium matsuzakiense]GLL03281.1 penicillin-binding protein [Dactylosporangium matsuzakiense]